MAEEQFRYHSDPNNRSDAEWQNPEITGRNKLPGRSQQLPYSSAADTESPWTLSLDGEWQFKWYPNPA
ncbi:MAG: hypothetical protein J7L76_04490, partial [Spirochaetaceae bacterium]|nr:hypothetical protein [Spirochaetaceae bacterium]